MGLIMFYQLSHSSTAQTARALLEKSRVAGWQVMVRGTDQPALEALDQALWHGPTDSFLPHGLDTQPHANLQSILLGSGAAPQEYEALMLIDGAAFSTSEVARMKRMMILFDGQNEAVLNQARMQWKEVATLGQEAQFWSEASGSWALQQSRRAD